jgi:predicted DCC family thiol-disulfide oxidoreductase YuxK
MRDERHILFYDGTCGICSRSVRFILKNESDERLNFAALQSDFSSEFLGNFDIESSNLTTLYFYSNGIIYSKSRALFALLPFLKWYYSFFYLGFIIPRFILDFFYDRLAKNRKRFFSSTCDLNMFSKSRFIP